ncbi:hypothetical protein GO495_02330 [Chitinophaga oryziterrae]|uniref:Uncharacterized protein n=1 Tax=Chitinophaga oryziterrae TaxID=1031224 RepID=A0A6N8J3R8_9BACT|nr:hypothetical protein [Chitinophaga oryziterrae]MVT39411.1 hypothetical protein [Chitinophaga oryziterrae]
MTLPALKQDLIDRWLTVYDEYELRKEMKDTSVKMVYAETIRFGLDKYTKEKFPAQGPLSAEERPEHSYAYGLDALGKPCFSMFEEQKNYYTYTDSLIEYVEYNQNSPIPSSLQRVIYEGDRKVGFQSIILNDINTRQFAGMTGKPILTKLLKEASSVICIIESYDYKEDRIINADCLHIMPGVGEYSLRKKYNYNSTGELEEIINVFGDKRTSYDYVKIPSNITLQQLSEQVSSLIAEDIIKTLADEDLKEPLGILEINYQEIGDYSPVLTIYSEKEQKKIEKSADRLTELLANDERDYYIDLSANTHERLLVAFMQEVEELEDFSLAESMIRKVACLLNASKLNNEVTTGAKFMAYSVDWSIGPEDFSTLLAECGLPENIVKEWRS